MHVDRARAEHEPLRDLAVRQPLGDEAHHLELAPREARRARDGRCAAAELLARARRLRGDRGRDPLGERLGAQSAREPVGLGEPFERRRRARLPRRAPCPRAAGSARARTGSRVRRAAPARGRAAAAPRRCRLRRARSRRARRRARRARRDGPPRRRSPTVPRRTRGRRRARRCGRSAPPPSAGPRRRSDGPRCAPSARAPGGSVPAPRRVALLGREPGERRGGVALHGHDVQTRCGAQRASSSGRAASGRPRHSVDRAEHAVGDERVVRARARADQPLAQLDGLVPVAELAQHVGHAAEAHLLERAGVPGLAEPERRRERVAGAAVVTRDLVGGAQALVDLRGLRGQLVLEREGQARRG